MNQQAHKIIYNRVRNAWMVVSELTTSNGQQKNSTQTPAHQAQPHLRTSNSALALAIAALLNSPMAYAQISVDTSGTAAKPILGAANGVAVINIATPNAAGVSNNRYTAYNVPAQGVVLNNSPNGATTTLAGTIGGNSQIGAVPASTILNQVTGTTVTTLAGSQEIAGQRANLVIANPNGITVNGTSPTRFINANNVTLTTGRPTLNSTGAIDNYRVTGGRVTISTPINARNNSQLDILARAVTVASNIRADGRDLNLVTGANTITTDLSDVAPIVITTHPTVAVDVKALGGMYAGQINLIATEQGVGVNNAGVIALSKSAAGANASLSMDINGNLTNTKGTISGGGYNSAVFSTFNVTEAGNGNVDIRSSGDVTNTSGMVQGRNVSVSADGDITVASLTKTTKTGNMANSTATGTATQVTTLDGIGTIKAYGADQTLNYTLATGEKLSYDAPALTLDAGKNINLKAAAISSNGSAEIYAGQDIVSSTVATVNKKRVILHTISKKDHGIGKPNSYTDKLYDTSTTEVTEVGSAIKAKGNLNMVATNAINATAATMAADKHVGLSAAVVTLDSGRAIDDYLRTSFEDYSHGYTRSSAITTTTKQTLDATHGDSSQGTQIIGDSVGIYAKGIFSKGSTIFGQNNVDLVATAGSINLDAASDNYLESHKSKTKSFYDFDVSWPDLSFSFGTTSQIETIKGNKHAFTGTAVTSLGGDINLSATKGNIAINKGTVDALAGDVSLTARNILIRDLNETAKTTLTNKYKFTGLRLQVNSPILAAANMGRTIYDQSKDATGTTQVAALSVSGALAAYNAYRNLTDMFNATANAKTFSEAAGQLGSVSLSLGVQKQFNQTVSQSSTSNGSQVTAGGTVKLLATGAGKAATADNIEANTGSDIFVQGSTVAGTAKTILKADDDIQLIAGRSGAKVKTTESTADASIGASASISGFSLNAAASGGKAYKSTEELMNNEAIIGDKAGQTQLISGHDTNLIGSQVFGKHVYADVGRNLSIRSLQDSYTFDSTKKNYGVSLTAPFGGAGFGLNVNAGKTTMLSRYTSVIEQAGIYAGKGGFDLNVKGTTVLKSGKITATSGDWAKNTLHTQALLLAADLNNSAAYRANAVSASIGFNTDTSQGYYGITPSAPVAMAAKDTADSTTHSTINGNVGNAAGLTPVITGTGTLDRADDALDSAALHKIFDEKKINTGFAIASTLGQNLSEFRTIKARDIDKAGKAPAKDANGNPIIGKDGQPLTVAQAYQLDPNDVGYGQATGENYDTYETLQKRWGNGGAGTIILSAIAGAVNGNVTATGSQFAQNAVINVVRQYTATEIKRVADSLQNVDPVTGVRTNSVLSELVRGALHAMASCGGSVAVGGSCRDAAGAAAATVALNNLLIRKDVGTLTEAQKLAYSNLVQTLVTGAAVGVNMDSEASNIRYTTQIEIDNNALKDPRTRSYFESDFNRNCSKGGINSKGCETTLLRKHGTTSAPNQIN